jgi:hypothetical protein
MLDCPFNPEGHVFEVNDEDGPDYDYCTHCRIYRHEATNREPHS